MTGETHDPARAAREHMQFAEVQLFHAGFLEGHDGETMVAEAMDAMFKAERLVPGCAAWRLACLSAQFGKDEICRKWLERAAKTSSLPAKEEFESCEHMARMRELKWFRQFVKRHGLG